MKFATFLPAVQWEVFNGPPTKANSESGLINFTFAQALQETVSIHVFFISIQFIDT